MSKINATYSSGYYIAPDVDFRKLEEAQRQEQRGKRKAAGADSADGGGDDNVKRQTFAIPFDLICQHCHRRIARGSHVYTNRRATEQRYLDSIRVWELEILCRFCQGKYYLRTDPETPKETGGYVCGEGCKRVEGDFYSLNKQNQEAREEREKAKAEAELDPLAALEKENEAARLLEERNRQIEEEVEQQAGHNDSDLLQMLRSRPRRNAELTDRPGEHDGDGVSDGDEDGGPDDKRKKTATSTGLPPPPPPSSSNHFDSDKDGTGETGDVAVDEDEEDADERSYREFAEDMERRWRALERQQRAQQRKELESATVKPTVQEEEVDRVLARYGGNARLAKAPPAESGGSVAGASSLQPENGAQGTGEVPTASALPVTTAAAAPPPLHRNKFLVDDDADDDDDGDVVPRQQQHQQHRVSVESLRPLASVSVTPRQGTGQALLPQLGAPRQGSSALLRNLVDSDSDDDA